MQQPSLMDPFDGISLDTLEEMCGARHRLLEAQGMDRQAALILATYEIHKRIELAKTHGPEVALLANTVWKDMGDSGFALSVVPDGTPASLKDRFFVEADLYFRNVANGDLID